MTPQTQIEELARSKLLGRRVDPVGFIDELLGLASRAGEIHGTFASDEALRFTIPEQQTVFEVPVDRARGKLRMLCANLGVRCNESGGQDVSIYGGEGVITKAPAFTLMNSSPNHEAWKVRFKNTPGEHEFTIQSSVRQPKPCQP